MIRRVAIVVAVLAATALQAPSASAAVKCSPTNVQPRPVAKFTEPTTMLKPKTYRFVFNTNCGKIVVAADAKNAPITVRNLAFLARSKYFNNSLCHRLVTEGIYVLQCGDPSGSGKLGPGFQYQNENLPTSVAKNRYPAGTVAMANSGAGTNGSQFFFVYRDGTFDLPPQYTIWGRVISGLDILKAIAAKGTVTGETDEWPAQAVAVNSVTVSEGTP